jgi:RHS repeat-associated protein
MTYDSLSRVHTIQDGNGATRTFTYDPLDRITQIAYSSGATIGYQYDANGNMTQRTDSVAGTSTYQYDALNRRTQDTLPSGTTTYGWDAGSNLTSLSDAGGTVTYRYDSVDRLQDLAEPGGSCTTPVSLCTTFGYTTRDQRNSTAYPNGVTQSVTYDTSDKPTTITGVKAGSPPTTLTSFTYDYKVSPTVEGKLLRSVTDKNGNKTTYTYDTMVERLLSAVEKNSGGTTIDTRSYTYDNASNQKTRTINGSTVTFAYNGANEMCWHFVGTSANSCLSPPAGADVFSYDSNGNTLGANNGLDFDYNIRDQTTSWTPPGGSATTFSYAGPGQTERTSIGGATQHNTMLGLTREGTTEWTRDSAGALISQNVSGTRHYYLADRLGSIVGLSSNTGTLAQSYSYDPFGLIKSSSGSVTNPFQFTGEYVNRVGIDGLYKIGARYYSPGGARWFQADPIEQPDDLRSGNRYAYAAADPVNHTDSSGLFPMHYRIPGVWVYCGTPAGRHDPDCQKDNLSPTAKKAADCAGGLIVGRVAGPITVRGAIASCIGGILGL